MDLAQLKQELIREIECIDDPEVLETLLDYLSELRQLENGEIPDCSNPSTLFLAPKE